MNLMHFVGVNLGVLSLLAITPIQKPTLNTETYKTHLFMLDMGNWERESKEKEWAEVQPCVAYEPQTEEEKAVSAFTEGRETDTAVITQPVRQAEPSAISMETEVQGSPLLSQGDSETVGTVVGPGVNETPIFQVDGYVPDVNLQEYLYNRLAEHGIEWFMPYAVCLIAQESSWNPLAVNPNGRDRGILQYRVEFYSGLDWTNPCAEIDLFVQQMANRAMSGKTVSEMISSHMMSDYGNYNQAYVDAVMSHSGSLVRVR